MTVFLGQGMEFKTAGPLICLLVQFQKAYLMTLPLELLCKALGEIAEDV